MPQRVTLPSKPVARQHTTLPVFLVLLFFAACRPCLIMAAERGTPAQRFQVRANDIPDDLDAVYKRAKGLWSPLRASAHPRNEGCELDKRVYPCSEITRQDAKYPEKTSTLALFDEPYPPIVFFKASSSPSDPGPLMVSNNNSIWAPIENVAGGVALFRKLLDMESNGQLFGCDIFSVSPELIGKAAPACQFVAYGFDGRTDRLYISLCTAAIPGEADNPPEGCRPVIVLDQQRIWLQAGLTLHAAEHSGHNKSTDLSTLQMNGTDLLIRGGKLPSSSLLLQTIGSELHAMPNGFEIRQRTDTMISASGVYRNSPILAGWREWVRIDISAVEAHNMLSLFIIQTLYVNKLNTTNPHDWHMANPQQELRYSTTVKNFVESAVKKLCSGTEYNCVHQK